jgi:hypothetical protein
MKMVKGFTVQVNTGRKYTNDGQYIVIIYDAVTNIAEFHDVSRMIAGEVANVALAPDELFESQSDLVRTVLRCYDRGDYTNISPRAVFDATKPTVMIYI